MAKVTTLVPAKVDKEVSKMEQAVSALVVVDQGGYDMAATVLIQIREGKQRVIDALDPQREAAYAAYQIALTQLKKYKDPFELAEKTVKSKMESHLIEQRNIEMAEQKRLNELAEAEAEKERQALLKKAAKTKNPDKAEDFKEAAESVFVTPGQVAPIVEKADGVAHRFATEVVITDMLELVKAIANGTVSVNVNKLFTAKAQVLKELVDLTGVKAIPGCIINKKPILSVTGRK